MADTGPTDRYCSLWNTNPQSLRDQGVPQGFCGYCEICGQPGHTQHFPGAVPYTGAWCSRHLRWISVLHPMAFPGTLVWLLGLTLIVVLAVLIFR